MSLFVRTSSDEETERLGVRLGAALEPGDVLGLIGVLGAGKTRLVHGLVRGLASAFGVEGALHVCSPSYTIINTYERDGLCIHHLDLYRLSDIDDLESTGYWDAIEDPEAISLIEWIDQIPEAEPVNCVVLTVEIEDTLNALTSPRLFTLRASGGEGEASLERMQRALEALRAP